MSEFRSSRDPVTGAQTITFVLDEALLIAGPAVETGFAYLRAACEAFEFAKASRDLRNMGPGAEPPVLDAEVVAENGEEGSRG